MKHNDKIKAILEVSKQDAIKGYTDISLYDSIESYIIDLHDSLLHLNCIEINSMYKVMEQN